MKEKKWDVFISHASEDKITVALPLAKALKSAGVRVWLDQHELRIGDSLSEKIDQGLSESQFGVVILSPAFLMKHWPKKELSGLRAKEESGHKVILPVWHNVDKQTITEFSPVLADVLGVGTNLGIDHVVEKILDAVFYPTSGSPSIVYPSVARRLIEMLDSIPRKEDFLEFLRFHFVYHRRVLGLRNGLELKKYRLYDREFDAFLLWINHGCFLTLVSFTEAWKNPFEIKDKSDDSVAICSEVNNIISNIRRIQQIYKDDLETQAQLRREIDYPGSYVPRLEFFIFAGRRSIIDASKTTHDVWSRLLNENRDINIRSYDYLIDGFLTDDERL